MVVSTGTGYSATGSSEKQVRAANRMYAANTRRGCILAHGAGADASYPLTIPYGTGGIGKGIIEALTRRGIPVVSADLGGTSTWGNDTAISRITDAYNYLIGSSSGFAQASGTTVLLLGFSMGALNLQNWAKSNLSKVAAMALCIPVLGLDYWHDNTANAANIETAYGGSAPYEAALPTHDPMQWGVSLVGQPLHIWAASDDVGEPTLSANYATLTGATVSSIGAVGHTASAVPSETVADYLWNYAA